jgi:spermidine/putrescine transport system permease protein
MTSGAERDVRYPAALWQTLSVPGLLWLLLLFVVPFYAVLAIAFGGQDPIFFSPVPEWNPARWQTGNIEFVAGEIFSPDAPLRAVFLRTFSYVGAAVVLCLLLGYPVAYYISKQRGTMRGILLALVLAPFWVSYLMRMLAWVNLLEVDGYVNKVLTSLGVLQHPYPWLEGKAGTVVLGLLYGYVPFLILPLFAALDRIDRNVVEAGRDLGGSPTSTFVRVTLPMSKHGVIAGLVIITLPMFGDYYTTDLLSGRINNTMIGNQIAFYVTQANTGGGGGKGAALVLALSLLISALMVHYLITTARASRELRDE